MFSPAESTFIGLCLEGYFFGLYSAIFAMYLHWQFHIDKKKNTLFYLICILYFLCVAILVLDTVRVIHGHSTTLSLYFISTTIIGCCDFFSQSILIYRCWVVWGGNVGIVIIPSVLAVASLAMWLATNGSIYLSPGEVSIGFWGYILSLTSYAISLTVNALVTGFIVFRIFKVYRQVKISFHDGDVDQNLSATGGSKLRATIFVLIESGMAMFAIQVVRVVLAIIEFTYAAPAISTMIGNNIILGMNQMLYGITPTIILVRVQMGLSFHDEESMAEATASLCFASNNPISNSTMGSIGIVGKEGGNGIGIPRLSDDSIQLVERDSPQ